MPVPGRVQRLAASADGGSTWVTVGGLQDAEYSSEAATIDTTSKDSGEYSEFLYGITTQRITGTVLLDEANQGQSILHNAHKDKTIIKVRWRAKEATGWKQYIADALVTRWPQSAPVTGPQTRAFELQLTGAPTESTQ